MKHRGVWLAGLSAALCMALAACGGGRSAARSATTTVSPQRSTAAQSVASAQQIASITLAPAAVKLRNPTSTGASGSHARVKVSLKLTGPDGRAITTGALSDPIRLRVYGPSPAVLKPETPTLRSARSTIYFDYDGRFFANPLIVTAVSGRAFALMSFQPEHRGFPGSSSVTFPMSSRDNIARGWGMDASVGGGRPHFVEIDTGSRGLVVPTSVLGREAVGPGPAAKITYTSDGKEFVGHYYLAPLTLRAGGAQVQTVPVRVLGVDKSACAPGYPHCRAGPISGLGVMGVGFARGKPSSLPPELTNAFLALTAITGGSMHPGYIIRKTSVTLGITPQNQAGFAELPLTAGGSGPGDWNTAPGCFAFPSLSSYPRKCGTVLVDTGIASAILGLPRSERPASMRSRIPNRTQVETEVGPPAAAPILSYRFTTGAFDQPLTPTSIRWAGDPQPFVNTGRHPIALYDYLFDDASGRVGFRRS